MSMPVPTPVYRFLHIDNLRVCLRRGALHAPNHTPRDAQAYRTIHDLDIQRERKAADIPCGPRGVILDYVAFYFGPRSPMLLRLHTGRVERYAEQQEPLVYLVSSVQAISESGARFVFSDGHGIARFTSWFDDLARLEEVDWDTVYARSWNDSVDDMDRQRRKQAEFLVHEKCAWALISEIGVATARMKDRVEQVLTEYTSELHRPVNVRREWYY